MADYNQLLYDKMQLEFNKFISKLKQMKPEDVIHHSYEKVMKEDILLSVEDDFLSQDEAKALYSLTYPLNFVYNEWLSCDRSYMELLRDTVQDCSDKAKDYIKTKSSKER